MRRSLTGGTPCSILANRMSAETTIWIDLLGLLPDRSMHGYELLQQIEAEGVDEWLDVGKAGVGYSLAKPRDRGFVTEPHQHSTRSADVSISGLTATGQAAFFGAMEAQAASREPAQIEVVSRRSGRDKARQSREWTQGQLSPELQAVARRYALDRLPL